MEHEGEWNALPLPPAAFGSKAGCAPGKAGKNHVPETESQLEWPGDGLRVTIGWEHSQMVMALAEEEKGIGPGGLGLVALISTFWRTGTRQGNCVCTMIPPPGTFTGKTGFLRSSD